MVHHEEGGREDLTDPDLPATGITGEDPPADNGIAAGRRLFANPCRFVAGAATIDAIPPSALPEIAFAGRSNVGKSSLVNALTGRRTLAKTSRTPGRTRQLNFFELGDALMLADLPGFGYARAGKQEVARWTQLVDDYLLGRAPLRRVLLLIDARRGPGAPDRQVMQQLDRAAVSYQLVLTKADKVPAEPLAAVVAATNAILPRHTAAYPEIVVTSAETGQGIAELRAALGKLAEWRTG